MTINWKRPGFVAMWIPVIICVASIYVFDEPLWDNETQRIAVVRHFVDPTWIPDDWLLNTSMIYQIPFILLAAPLVAFLDMGIATILLRLILVVWFASGVVAISRRLEIGLLPLVPAVVTFSVIRCLAAAEWMVGHAEAKVVAYGAILWAISLIFDRRYAAAAGLLGLATTFHVLVGLYATLTCIFFLVSHPRHRKMFIKALHMSTSVFLIAGGFGIFVVVNNLLLQVDSDPLTDLIYIARNAHHVWPPAWSEHVHPYLPGWVDRSTWIAKTVVSVSFLIFVAVRSRNPCFREFAQLALSSAVFFALGLLIFLGGPVGLLKYLIFRFPDVLIPFAASLLFYGLWDRAATEHDSRQLRPSVKAFLGIGLASAAGLALVGGMCKLVSDVAIKVDAGVPWAFVNLSGEEREITHWISDNTPVDAIFLTDPFFAPFYLTAERGVLVAWKHFPQNEQDVREWHDRLVAVNGGHEVLLNPPGIAESQIRNSFESLPLEEARLLAKKYDLDYYHGPVRDDWAITPIYRTQNEAVYRLP